MILRGKDHCSTNKKYARDVRQKVLYMNGRTIMGLSSFLVLQNLVTLTGDLVIRWFEAQRTRGFDVMHKQFLTRKPMEAKAR